MATDPAKPELSTEARLLAAWLHRHARGRRRAVPYRRLAAALAEAGCRVSEREVYELIAELQLAGRPVGTTPRRPRPGAFICVDDEDWKAAEANLEARLYRPLARLRRLRRTRRELQGGQAVLAMPEAPPLTDARGQGLLLNPSGYEET